MHIVSAINSPRVVFKSRSNVTVILVDPAHMIFLVVHLQIFLLTKQPPTYLFSDLFVYQFTFLPTYLAIYLSIYLPIHVSIQLNNYLSKLHLKGVSG
jgi:hypothetical protein